MTYLWRFFRKLLLFVFIATSTVLAGVLYYIEFQLPDIDALNTIQLQVPLQLFTHDGKLITEYGEIRRIPIPFNKIPKSLIDAVLATEDQRYFAHPGIDLPGLMRASVQLILTGRKEQGGSTITMQVARSFYLSPRKTFGRKLREILLALKIEHRLTKQKILELYLNKIFFGNRAYGVAAAAEIYYGKPLDQLTLAQYAMIAGLPKAPSTLNPLADPYAAEKRRNHVLARMLELHYITEKAYQEAIKSPLDASYHGLQIEVKAPYAAELVRQQLEQMYGDSIYTDGFNVYTTIDSHLQETANLAVRHGLLAYDQRHGYRGPEQNLGPMSLKGMENWEESLQDIPTVNGLEPAAVVDMTEKTITALRGNGMMVTIPWEGLSWARKQVNADYLGRAPNKAHDILKLGDVIRIIPSTSNPNNWRLAQIPKAEAGIVTLNPQNGQILAMVGGFDFQRSNFNRITSAARQPGSSFKPFVFSAALDKSYTLATVINDAPIVVENPDGTLWRPQNTDRRFYGPTRLRDALVHSRNLVSIRLLELIGVPYAIDYIERFGFTKSQLPPTLSLALGTASVTPLEMATGYAVFANGGFKVTPYAIDTIRSAKGEILYQAKPLNVCADCTTDPAKPDNTHAPRIISAQNAFLIHSVLHDVIEEGSAVLARSIKRTDIAGKTGTTNNQVDAWFAGYNSDLITISWMGFDYNQSLHEFGAQAALPIWIEFMQTALKDKPEHTLPQPPNIVSIRIDPMTGKRATAEDPLAKPEYFTTSNLPEEDTAPQPQGNSTTAPGNGSLY